MHLIRWNKETTPSLDSLRITLGQQGFQVLEWTDLPGTVYPVRQHPTVEVRWIVRGKLRIGIPDQDEEIVLGAGDRLELEPNELYWADVEDGHPVTYLIATRNGHEKNKKQKLFVRGEQ